MKRYYLLVIIVSFLILILTCSKDTPTEPEGEESSDEIEITITTTEEVGSSGGTLTDPSGCQVAIPAGALSQTTTIEIGTAKNVPIDQSSFHRGYRLFCWLDHRA